MTLPTQPATAVAPSVRMLARTTAIALAVAGAILVTVVLPAEYGVDPLGTGRRLGLTEIASPRVTPVEPPSTADGALIPTQNGPLGIYPAAFKVDVFEVTLAPYEYVEYKYRLEKDATMLYSWSATAVVKHDFHGERSAGAGDTAAEQSFDQDDRREASGSLTAPFAGIHGWYWENPGADTITIKLTSAGYYTSAVEIRSDRTRRTRTLRNIDTLQTGDTR